MKNIRVVGYWVVTVLFCLAMLFSGIMNLLRVPEAIEVMNHLGYPHYLLTILGVAKVLGACALLAPGLPLLKEWAYAGFTIDMIGAAFSHAAVGDSVSQTAGPLLFLAVAAVSYHLRPASRRVNATYA